MVRAAWPTLHLPAIPFRATLRTAGGAAGVLLVAGIGCALVGVGLGDYDLVEMLVIAAVWAAIILTAVLAARRRGLPVLWALLGALLIPFVITHRYDSAPVYLRLLLQAPDAFAAWSVFAIPLAAATALRPHGASDSPIRPTPIAVGAIVWLALYTASAWTRGSGAGRGRRAAPHQRGHLRIGERVAALAGAGDRLAPAPRPRGIGAIHRSTRSPAPRARCRASRHQQGG